MNPEDIDEVLDRANRLLEEGKPNESLKCLESLNETLLDGDDRIEWASLRAWALSEMGYHEEAADLLEDTLEEHPESSRLLGTLGVVLSNMEELDEARLALEEAVKTNPDDEVALANLALVYEKLREYHRAIDAYDRALNMGADIDWILQRKAAVLSEFGDYREAKITLKRYLSLVPDDIAQWIQLGILHSDDDEFDQAFACYRQAERIEPQSPSLRLNWGVTAVRARRLDVAYEQLSLLQQLEPRSTRWVLLRAFISEEEGNVRGASEVYERVLKRRRFADRSELTYALEMAMDFFARHKRRQRCRRLMRRAYDVNACTVELCEAYREAAGEYVEKAYWFSLMVEADYREGLAEVHDDSGDNRPYTRFVRDFQVIARDHDDALTQVLEFARQMDEHHVQVREFVGQEPVEDAYLGIYEVEQDSYVFAAGDDA